MTFAHFKASQVAALMGKNTYQPREAEFLKAALSYKNQRTRRLCLFLQNKHPEVQRAVAMLNQESFLLGDMEELKKAVNEAVVKRREVQDTEIKKLEEEARLQAEEKKLEGQRALERAREAEREKKVIEDRAAIDASRAKRLKREEILLRALESGMTSKQIFAKEAVSAGTATRTQDSTNTLLKEDHIAQAQTMSEALEVVERTPATQLPRREIRVLADKAISLDSRVQSKGVEAESASFAHSASLALCSENAAKALHLQSKSALQCSETLGGVADPKAMQIVVDTAVCMKRGREEEAQVLDECESTLGKITERNKTLGSFQGKEYYLVGMIDGLSKEGIVELKMHRFMPYRPRLKDIIKLRIYLRMFNQTSGILIEKSYKGESRETIVEDNDEEWAWIDNELNLAGRALNCATEQDILLWAKKVIDMNIKG